VLNQAADAALVGRVARRLLPFLALLYFVAFLDRVNVGYAALTMNADIGLSATAYGFGAGVFFLGYFLFEVPSNLILHRVGARLWIARIMISWGLISMATALVQGPIAFFVLRFLLGVAEAGFFPGIILYLTYWFPSPVRGRIIGGFMLAIPVSNVIGAPVSTALLETSVFGLAGWQTMFVVEGLPAVLLGLVVAGWLPDRPADAGWLTSGERRRLQALLDSEPRAPGHLEGIRASLVSGRVWLLSTVYFGLVLGLYGLGFWAPQIIAAFGTISARQVGLLTALPYACAAVSMAVWGRRSDRARERIWHVCLPACVGAAGFLVSAFVVTPGASLAALTVGAIGIYAALPVFWALATSRLSGVAAASGIALINSIGNLSGYLGPYAVGRLRDWTGGYGAGLMVLSAGMAGAGILVAIARAQLTPVPAPSAPRAVTAPEDAAGA
jgi:ACS family tartrate transporter-like MFS transporter